MSVKVENLTKIYGTQKAVDDISFEVGNGQVLGFLGPNGAGKTTTMKIITCFIPQSAGKAYVCGHDVEKESIEVRKKIGYLPENNPLYLEMYVKEYLGFVASVYKVGNAKNRIEEMIQLTGLKDEQKKKLGQLSKGYRQRVGLAQAMLHNPEVLILDEPTSGLDPNQLVEIRSLIKSMGKEKTVILSTHIMQEVEAICDRVIIINKGKLVANNTVEQLQQKAKGTQIIKVEFKEQVEKEQLQSIEGVSEVNNKANNVWLLSGQQGKDLREAVASFAKENELTVLTMQLEESRLEEVFQKLTSPLSPPKEEK